jgi:dipeptidyl aminopeptidase/acylaminoacyl peptidase
MRVPSCLVAACAAVLTLPAVLSAQQLSAQQRLDPEGLWRLQRVGELTLSPDGRWLAFSVRSTELAENRSAAKVCLLDLTQPGAGLREFGAGSSPVWLPGSHYLAVVTKDGIEARPLGDGPVVAVAVAGGVANLQWSPKGEHFSYTQDVKVDAVVGEAHPDLPKARARAYDDLMVRHWDHWLDGSYSHLFVMPYTGGGGGRATCSPGERVHTPLPPFGGGEQIAWSPDGRELCYTARRVDNPEASTDSSLWAVPSAAVRRRT